MRQGSDVARLMGEQAISVTLSTRDLQTAGHRTDPRSGQDHCAATAVEQGAQGEFGAMALHRLAREDLLREVDADPARQLHGSGRTFGYEGRFRPDRNGHRGDGQTGGSV